MTRSKGVIDPVFFIFPFRKGMICSVQKSPVLLALGEERLQGVHYDRPLRRPLSRSKHSQCFDQVRTITQIEREF